MRITLTGRRLALAAVLVLAGVAAPLAWATVAGKGGSTPSAAAAASPRLIRSAPLPSLSPVAATATADNPYQHTLVVPLPGGSNICNIPGFPAGNFALTQVSVFPSTPVGQTYIRAFVKSGASSFISTEFNIPLDAQGGGGGSAEGGARSFDLVVKPNGLASAAVGDVYDIYGCAINPTMTAGTIAFVFTGQKITTGPTPVSVSDFTARPRAQGALLRWTTGSESNLLGFNVWRYRGAKGVKVNRTLIRAKRSGEPAGASYRYVDYVRGAKRGLTYRLQLIDLKGKRTWYAAFAIAAK